MYRPSGIPRIGIVGLVMAVLLVACSSSPSEDTAAGTTSTTTLATTTTGSVTTTSTTIATTTTEPGPPPPGPRYVLLDDETAPDAKRLAVDIAYDLTTYEETDDPMTRYLAIAGEGGVEALVEAAEPLTNQGQWSRGEILYPQLGGLTEEKVSVMTVTQQTIGAGSEAEFTLVRTLDIRLVMGESGWEFDELASAGGVFDDVEDLLLAHAVAADPRIEMPDSARLDILGGEVSPVLLAVMLDIADITSYGITVMATGHPYHVFETNKVSHHTIGRAIDINRIGDRHVIDDRTPSSTTHALVQWLWGDNRVVQVGSPWDVDAASKKRSFVNTVHQDHIHVAVIGPNDPTWVPAIGNRVWEDLDADGIQDQGEPGIGGVTVRLFNGNGTGLGSTVTSSSGAYEFRDLSYGDFRVEVDLPGGGYYASPRNQGDDDSVDSDVDGSGVMSRTTLDPREHDPTWDAGFYRLASVGDLVWDDLDADGIQDEGEPGFAGIAVHLYDDTGTLVAATVTDGDGVYRFEGLVPGVYSLEIFRATGYVPTLQDQGEPDPGDPDFDPDTADSDFDANGVTGTFRLYSGQYQDRWDAGLTLSASLGNRVWEDLDADGIQEDGEPGIPGVTVRLFRGSTQVASAVTGADGSYAFADLIPGVYHVEFEVPAGFVASPQDQGADDAVDSDIDAGGVAPSTTLTPGEIDTRWDAGFVQVP